MVLDWFLRALLLKWDVVFVSRRPRTVEPRLA